MPTITNESVAAFKKELSEIDDLTCTDGYSKIDNFDMKHHYYGKKYVEFKSKLVEDDIKKLLGTNYLIHIVLNDVIQMGGRAEYNIWELIIVGTFILYENIVSKR
jgi:hypothetical protein